MSKRLPFGFRAGFSVPIGLLRRRAGSGSIDGIGYVYVIAAADGMVKVGMTTNPRARLAALQTASRVRLAMAYLLATDQDPGVIETMAHRMLAPYCVSGEWFDIHPDVAVQAVDRAAAVLTGQPVAQTDTRRILGAVADGRIKLVNPAPQRPSSAPLIVAAIAGLAILFILQMLG